MHLAFSIIQCISQVTYIYSLFCTGIFLINYDKQDEFIDAKLQIVLAGIFICAYSAYLAYFLMQ